MTVNDAGSETRSSLSDEDVIQARDSLEMMRRPHLWPHHRLLPLKKRHEDHTFPDLIVLCALGPTSGGGVRYTVKEGPMGLVGDIVAQGGDFLLRTLVDAGWEVD